MQTHYDQIGGAERVRELTNRFYDLMHEMPEAYELRKMHGPDLEPMKQKLYEFLSGWLGGPQLYVEKYGHPRLRARHLPFPVNIEMRDQWLLCMETAMDDMGIDGPLRSQLSQAFAKTGDHMRNQAEAPGAHANPTQPGRENPFPIGPSAAERKEHGLD